MTTVAYVDDPTKKTRLVEDPFVHGPKRVEDPALHSMAEMFSDTAGATKQAILFTCRQEKYVWVFVHTLTVRQHSLADIRSLPTKRDHDPCDVLFREDLPHIIKLCYGALLSSTITP